MSKITIKKPEDANTIKISEVIDHYLNGVPKTEDADFEVIPDEPESPTLSRNLIDDAGLWGGDKLLTIKTKEG